MATLLSRLIAYKSKGKSQKRVHAIAMTVIDTGLRIGEVISLRETDVDTESMVLRVMGKGRRERMMPFSPELRRIQFRYHAHPPLRGSYVFGTLSGSLPGCRNLFRDYHQMLSRIGVTGVRGFHRLRHTFASEYMKRGGNQFHLQRMLGHSDIKTTAIYVHAAIDDLRGASILTGWRRNEGDGKRYGTRA